MLNRPFFVFLSILVIVMSVRFYLRRLQTFLSTYKILQKVAIICCILYFLYFFLQKYLNSQIKLLRNYFTLFCIASSVSPCLVNNVIVILTPLNSSKNTCVFTEFWKWILNKHDILYFLIVVSIAFFTKNSWHHTILLHD